MPGARERVVALMRKDVADLLRRPGATFPALAMSVGALLPPFLVVIGAPMLAESGLGDSDEFADAARASLDVLPEIAHLAGKALIQAFLFHQFTLLLLFVPMVASMALGAHAVISEKQSRSLEPLLATPLTTAELLAAKTLTPLLFAVALMWLTFALYVFGIWAAAETGVWRTLLSARSGLMAGALGPLAALAALLVSVVVSSRVNDARSAQQLASLLILPISGAFIFQMVRFSIVSHYLLAEASVALLLLNLVLLWVGVHVFQRETILTRWK